MRLTAPEGPPSDHMSCPIHRDWEPGVTPRCVVHLHSTYVRPAEVSRGTLPEASAWPHDGKPLAGPRSPSVLCRSCDRRPKRRDLEPSVTIPHCT